MSWYWKEVDDQDSAKGATRAAVGVSYFVAALTGLFAVLSLINRKPIFELDGWSLVDAALFVVIGWRIGRLSRAWSVVGLCLYVLEVLSSIGTRGFGIGVMTIVFIIMYINAIRGTFAYHKHVKLQAAQPPESASLG